MARKPTGNVTKHRASVPQKNGDIYIYDREYRYDAETKKTKRISNRLVAKIPQGTNQEVPTRPKRGRADKSGVSAGDIHASRWRSGLPGILDRVGEASGMDAALLASTDEGTALKTMSVARFLVATGGDSLPHIETWQLTHPIPYANGITEDIYHDLCRDIGTDERFRQRLFGERCKRLGTHPLIAYDSTTQSTYSEMQLEARYGFNKDGDGLKTIKHLVLYSVEDRQPIAFAKQPGNIPDVVSLSNALKQLEVHGVCGPEIVTDNGYYSHENLAAMCHGGFRFITLVKTSVAWVRKELDRCMDGMARMGNRRADLGGIYCHTVMLKHVFERPRKYASKEKGLDKGSIETFEKRLYLHLYCNPLKKENDDAFLYAKIEELKRMLEEGVPLDSMTEAAQKTAARFLAVKNKRNGEVFVTYNEEACADACKYHGYFALVANREKDRFEALAKYRKREKVEEYFHLAKANADAARPRVWYSDHLMGRMIIQFVALSYEDWLRHEIGKMKAELGKENGDPGHDTKENLKLELSLKRWLTDTSFSNVLRWFDAYETTEVSTAVVRRRWNSETTKRDRLFLEKLGM